MLCLHVAEQNCPGVQIQKCLKLMYIHCQPNRRNKKDSLADQRTLLITQPSTRCNRNRHHHGQESCHLKAHIKNASTMGAFRSGHLLWSSVLIAQHGNVTRRDRINSNEPYDEPIVPTTDRTESR